ncbi:hypothetical protein VTI28DRAFT_10315 [Corynascus sepedonium]
MAFAGIRLRWSLSVGGILSSAQCTTHGGHRGAGTVAPATSEPLPGYIRGSGRERQAPSRALKRKPDRWSGVINAYVNQHGLSRRRGGQEFLISSVPSFPSGRLSERLPKPFVLQTQVRIGAEVLELSGTAGANPHVPPVQLAWEPCAYRRHTSTLHGICCCHRNTVIVVFQITNNLPRCDGRTVAESLAKLTPALMRAPIDLIQVFEFMEFADRLRRFALPRPTRPGTVPGEPAGSRLGKQGTCYSHRPYVRCVQHSTDNTS